MFSVGTTSGHTAVFLENKFLRVTVLPEKGADIYGFVHKPRGVGFLLESPAGLRPPGNDPPADFLENYEGGWQELLPNVNDACEYLGSEVPFHGEVALLPWEWAVERDDEMETAVRFTVRCRVTPFHLTRLLRLPCRTPALVVEEAVTNESDASAYLVWGHHLVLGGGFLEADCRLEVPTCTLITPDELYEPETARLAAGQRQPWPFAHGRHPGERVDLRDIPGPVAHSHDDVFLTGFSRGYAAVSNPRLGLRFSLEWDAALFRYICLWQPFSGADRPPLTGIYGLGLEPWVSRYNLAQAIRCGEAIELKPRQVLRTMLRASVSDVGTRG